MSFLTILLPYSVLDETVPTSRAPGIPGMPVEAWKGFWLGPFWLWPFKLSAFRWETEALYFLQTFTPSPFWSGLFHIGFAFTSGRKPTRNEKK